MGCPHVRLCRGCLVTESSVSAARKWRSSLSIAPVQPSSWLRRLSSSCRRECVNVSSVPSATARSVISTSDSPGSSTPPVQRQLMLSRSGFTTSIYSPLLSCSLPSSMRKRTRKRPPTCGSVSATSTGPLSGPHQLAMPSGVVSASNTIDGRALIRRTRVRLVIVFSFLLRLPCFQHRTRADRGSSTRSVRNDVANPSLPSWARAGAVPSRCARLSTG